LISRQLAFPATRTFDSKCRALQFFHRFPCFGVVSACRPTTALRTFKRNIRLDVHRIRLKYRRLPHHNTRFAVRLHHLAAAVFISVDMPHASMNPVSPRFAGICGPDPGFLERAMGIEPTSEAWEASILPLYDARSRSKQPDYTQPRGPR
jgi:hypothetical protein